MITVIDEMNAEVIAMLQAFYSRSHQPINDRLLEFGNDIDSIKNSMGKYYINYGHESIADCGTITIFLEGVSLLAAKVFQDFPLYAGQESSTRYIDFSKQSWVEVNKQYNYLNQNLINFYLTSQAPLFEHLKTVYPGDMGDPKYVKTLKTKVFDILRGFLPGGMKTQLSWHTSLRQARARLIELSHHPLLEVRDICQSIITNLLEKYPDSFTGIYESIEDKQEFYKKHSEEIYYLEIPDEDLIDFNTDKINYAKLGVESWTIGKINRRNNKDPIPRYLELLPDFLFEFQLDFASARDLLRHRRGYIPLPVLDTRLNFNKWYLDQLSYDLKNKAITLLDQNKNVLNNSSLSKYQTQYYLPIGYNVPILAKLSMQQIIYMIELRSSKTVHPTLRAVIHKIAKIMEDKHKINKYCDIFCDYDDSFSMRRAEQDIVLK